MSRNGSGMYSRVSGVPYVYNTVIDQVVVNAEMDDIATALTASLAKDGQTTPTANLPMGTFRHTGVGAAAARTDYARAAEVQDGAITKITSVAGTNTITASAPISMAAYAVGQEFTFIPAATNTGAATLNINSIGAGAVQLNGAALTSGTIRQNVPVMVKVTAATPVFEIIGNGAFRQGLAASGANTDITSLSGAVVNTKRATVASHATTADIWAAAGNEIDWTGTATTTAFPNAPQAGASRILHCAAACSFTAGANMLIDGIASGSTITLAANDIVTVHAITASSFRIEVKKYAGTSVSGIQAKVGTFTRDMSTASGTQAVTGVGFTPKAVIFFSAQTNIAGEMSLGLDDGTTHVSMRDQKNAGVTDSYVVSSGQSISIVQPGSTNIYSGYVSSNDADGFTMTWTKTASPTGTVTVGYLAIR